MEKSMSDLFFVDTKTNGTNNNNLDYKRRRKDKQLIKQMKLPLLELTSGFQTLNFCNAIGTFPKIDKYLITKNKVDPQVCRIPPLLHLDLKTGFQKNRYSSERVRK